MSKNPNNPFASKKKDLITQKKTSEWGKVKFNPIAKDAREAPATPWRQFKNELLQNERETGCANSLNMNSKEAQDLLKSRQQNYKKMLITENSKVQTKWEDFEDETNATKSNFNDSKKANKNIKHDLPKKNIESKFNDSKIRRKCSIDIRRQVIGNNQLKNFDSKDLSLWQNLSMVKIITQSTTRYRSTVSLTVKDLKYKGLKPPRK